jgi:drug/metabolite transporter (DMT)-like permease
MRTLVVLFIAICAQTLGDVCLTKGMKAIGEVNTLNIVELLKIGIQVFTNPYVWLGIFILSIFFGLYLVALSWADLSFVVPVTAFGYVLNAFMSWQLLGERVSPLRWIGTVIICLGVAVVSRTEQHTTGKEAGATGATGAAGAI